MEVNQTGHCCSCRLQFRCPVCYPDDVDLSKARPSRKQEKMVKNLKAVINGTDGGFPDLIGQLELVRDEQDIEIGELKAELKRRDASPGDIMALVDAVLNSGIVEIIPMDGFPEPGRRISFRTPIDAVQTLIEHYTQQGVRLRNESSGLYRQLQAIRSKIDEWRDMLPEAFEDE